MSSLQSSLLDFHKNHVSILLILFALKCCEFLGSANLSLFHLQRCEHSFLDSQLADILQVLFSEKYYIGLHLSISKRLSHAGANLPQKYFSSYICSMLLLKSVLIRFFYFDCLMGGFNRRCNYDQADYQRLCHPISYITPPSFYITEPCFDVRAAALCKTAKGSPGLQYMSICDAEKSKLNLLLRWDVPSKTIPEQKVGKSKIYVDFCQDKKRGEQLCP